MNSFKYVPYGWIKCHSHMKQFLITSQMMFIHGQESVVFQLLCSVISEEFWEWIMLFWKIVLKLDLVINLVSVQNLTFYKVVSLQVLSFLLNSLACLDGNIEWNRILYHDQIINEKLALVCLIVCEVQLLPFLQAPKM